MYSVISTVTEFTVTCSVRSLDRSTFVSRAGYFLFLLREIFGGLGFAEPLGTPDAPDAPGNGAACCATNAEFSRGFRVDVPIFLEKKNTCYL